MTTEKNPETTPWFSPDYPPLWQGWYDFHPAYTAPLTVMDDADPPRRPARRWYGAINGKAGWSLAVRDHHTALEAEARRAMPASPESLEDCLWRGRVTPAPHYDFDLLMPAPRREVE